MKAINIGNRYEIYDDSLRTYDSLPAGVYVVEFSKMSGFHLAKHQDITINEKVYGVHHAKVEKVFRAFSASQRNLGVILSGKKGIGKSLCAKLLAIEAVKAGFPVILVEQYIPGIASYIESIEQECVVLFDEYDKTFGGVRAEDGKADTQAEMLGLFDGMAQGKKLFVITCNELRKLSDYLVNRPGRFHYHFRFENPSEAEIREYLTDKLDEAYRPEIDKVVAFSKRVDLNFDCLRAIATELNGGEPFETAILDLNIIKYDEYTPEYNVELRFVGGYTLTARRVRLDLFGDDESCVYLCDKEGDNILDVSFDAEDVTYDMRGCVVNADALQLDFSGRKDWQSKVEAVKAMQPECLILSRVKDRSMHYTV